MLEIPERDTFKMSLATLPIVKYRYLFEDIQFACLVDTFPGALYLKTAKTQSEDCTIAAVTAANYAGTGIMIPAKPLTAIVAELRCLVVMD